MSSSAGHSPKASKGLVVGPTSSSIRTSNSIATVGNNSVACDSKDAASGLVSQHTVASNTTREIGDLMDSVHSRNLSFGSMMSMGSMKEKIGAFENRIRNAEKVPIVPVLRANCRRSSSKSVSPQRRVRTRTLQPPTIEEVHESSESEDAVSPAQKYFQLKTPKSPKVVPTGTPIPKLSRDFIASVFHFSSGSVDLRVYPRRFLPPQFAPETELRKMENYEALKDTKMNRDHFRKLLDPNADPMAPRHVFEALQHLRSSMSQVVFPNGRTLKGEHDNKGRRGRGEAEFAQDEIYYYPETAEEEGTEDCSDIPEDKVTEDRWKYVRAEKPPNFLRARPDPVTAYLGFKNPPPHPGVEMTRTPKIKAPAEDPEMCRFMFNFQSFTLNGVNYTEPVHLEFFIVDILKKERVSETFRLKIDPKAPSPISSSCFFGVHKPRASLCLIVKMNRLLTGDPSTYEFLYFKGAGTSKEMKRHEDSIKNARKYLPQFTQGFAFGWSPLFYRKERKGKKVLQFVGYDESILTIQLAMPSRPDEVCLDWLCDTISQYQIKRKSTVLKATRATLRLQARPLARKLNDAIHTLHKTGRNVVDSSGAPFPAVFMPLPRPPTDQSMGDLTTASLPPGESSENARGSGKAVPQGDRKKDKNNKVAPVLSRKKSSRVAFSLGNDSLTSRPNIAATNAGDKDSKADDSPGSKSKSEDDSGGNSSRKVEKRKSNEDHAHDGSRDIKSSSAHDTEVFRAETLASFNELVAFESRSSFEGTKDDDEKKVEAGKNIAESASSDNVRGAEGSRSNPADAMSKTAPDLTPTMDKTRAEEGSKLVGRHLSHADTSSSEADLGSHRDTVAEMRELICGGVMPGPPRPPSRYFHFLYIYPQALSITSHRNLTIMTELCEIDQPEAQGVPAIFAGPGEPLQTSHISPLIYHLRKPKFLDEIKIALPKHLLLTHHVRFTFFNISLKTLKKGLTNSSLNKLTKIVGFSFLRLIRDGRLLDEAYRLRIYSDLPRSYIFSEMKLRQSPSATKDLFTVQASLMSTLFTNDPHISAFFGAMERLHVNTPEDSGHKKSDSCHTSSPKRDKNDGDSLLPPVPENDNISGTGEDGKEDYSVLKERLAMTTNRSPKTIKILSREIELTPILSCGGSLYSGYLSKRGNISSWVSRWFVLRKIRQGSTGYNKPAPTREVSGSTGYELVYYTDHTSVGTEEPRRLCLLTEGSVIKPRFEKQTRKAQQQIGFNLVVPGIESPIQLGCTSSSEMRTWRGLIAHASLEKQNCLKAISSVCYGKADVLGRFLPVLLRQILRVMCYADKPFIRVSLFRTLLRLFHSVQANIPNKGKRTSFSRKLPGFKKKRNSRASRSTLLEQYATYLFRDYAIEEAQQAKRKYQHDNPSSGSSNFGYPVWTYEALCMAWLETGDRRTLGSASQFSWLLLQIFYKSMVFHAQTFAKEKNRSLGDLRGDPDTFLSEASLGNLRNMIVGLADRVVAPLRGRDNADLGIVLNRSISLFLRDCYQVLDRSMVTDLVAAYVQGMTKPTMGAVSGPAILDERQTAEERKCELLHIISASPYFSGITGPIYLSPAIVSCLNAIAAEADEDTKRPKSRMADLGRKFSPPASLSVGVPIIEPKHDSKGHLQLSPEERVFRIPDGSPKDISYEDKAGIALASAPPEKGHFYARLLATELRGCLRRRRVLAPDMAVSLQPLENVGKVLRTIVCSCVRQSESSGRNQKYSAALFGQSFLPVVRVMWRQTKAMSTMKKTRALKDLLFIVIYVFRSVPASWILTAFDTPGSLMYIPKARRASWLQSMITLCTLILDEFSHSSTLATNILSSPRGKMDSSIGVAIAKSGPLSVLARTGTQRGISLNLGPGAAGKAKRVNAGTVPARVFQKALANKTNAESTGTLESRRASFLRDNKSLMALNLELPSPTPKVQMRASTLSEDIMKIFSGSPERGEQRRRLSLTEAPSKRSKTPDSRRASKHRIESMLSLEAAADRVHNPGGVVADARSLQAEEKEREMRQEIRNKKNAFRFRQKKYTHPYGKSSRVFYAEACQTILDIITNILVPACDEALGLRKPEEMVAPTSDSKQPREISSRGDLTPTIDARVGVYDEVPEVLEEELDEKGKITMHSQSIVLKFLTSILKAHTSVRVRRRTCMTVSWLLYRYEQSFFPISLPTLSHDAFGLVGISKCRSEKKKSNNNGNANDNRAEWETDLRQLWFSFLRQASCPGSLPTDALNVLYQLSHVTYAKYGTSAPFRRAAIEGFGDVVNRVFKLQKPLESVYLRNEEGVEKAKSGNYNPFLFELDQPRQTPARDKRSSISREDASCECNRSSVLEANMNLNAAVGDEDTPRSSRISPDISHTKEPQKLFKQAQSEDTGLYNLKKSGRAGESEKTDTDKNFGGLDKSKSYASMPRKFISRRGLMPEDVLLQGIQGIIQCARAAAIKDARSRKVDSGYLAASFQVAELFGRMATILQLLQSPFCNGGKRFSQQLPEMIAWRYVAIAKAYEDSPTLKAYYQSKLKLFHESNGDVTEAAVVASEMAEGAHKLLEQGNNAGAACLAQTDIFKSMTYAASSLYTQAGFAERAVEEERKLAAFHEDRLNYTAAAESYMRFSKLYKQIRDYEIGKLARSLGTYYRVEFFGARALYMLRASLPRVPEQGLDGLKELQFSVAGVEPIIGATKFVFKEKKITRLMEICDRLRGLEKLLDAKVVFLQSAGEDLKLKSEELGIRVTKLDPLPELVNGKMLKRGALPNKRGSHVYLQNSECRRFVYETPFTKSGKAHARSASEQYLRRTICVVAEAFPMREKMQPILSEEHINLTPIEAVAKGVRAKVRDITLKAFPLEGPAKLKTLNQVLSGAVNTQVHGGVVEIAESFLTEEAIVNFSVEHIEQLQAVLIEFLDIAERALAIARKVLEGKKGEMQETRFSVTATAHSNFAKDMAFQNILEERFEELQKKMKGYLDIAARHLAEADALDEGRGDDLQGEMKFTFKESKGVENPMIAHMAKPVEALLSWRRDSTET